MDRYLEYRPDDVAGWLLAGRTARRLERYSKAEACLIRCQQLGGVTEATRLEWDLFRVQQGNLGDIDIRLRTTITPEHDEAPVVLEALARGYMNCDRLLDAVEACDLWSARQPSHPWPWLWRGRIYERLSNFDDAVADYQQALKLVPDDRDVRLALGAILSLARQPVPAVGHFEHVLVRFPDDREALLGLARCRIEQGEPAEAVPLLQRVRASDPIDSRALVLLGRAALEQGDSTGAEEWLTQAIQRSASDAEALHLMLRVLQLQGKQAETGRLTRRLETLRQDIDRLDWLIRAIAQKPDDAALRHEAGMITLRLGRQDDGVHWLESALRCHGDHRASHAALAEHFAQHDAPRAERHRRLAETH